MYVIVEVKCDIEDIKLCKRYAASSDLRDSMHRHEQSPSLQQLPSSTQSTLTH
jgi:hypothetical protein